MLTRASANRNIEDGRRAARISVFASGSLALSNILLGWLGGSTSVLAAGVEFAGDVAASIIVFFGMTMAAKPADSNHPYGHGRVEILAGLMVGMIIAAAGTGICYHSLGRVGESYAPPRLFTVFPLAAAIFIKSLLSLYKFRVGTRIRSSSLRADAWNDSVDVLSSSAALIALSLTIFDPARFLAADHYGGFIVGVVVVITGIRVSHETSLQLMDTMPSEDFIRKVRQMAMEVHEVRGVEKCFARKTGLQYHVDLHLEVDPDISVRASHDIATRVRIHIKENFPDVADVLVHVEPAPEAPAALA